MKGDKKRSIGFNEETSTEFSSSISPEVLNCIPRPGQKIYVIVAAEGEDADEKGERIINNPELTAFYRVLGHPVRSVSMIDDDTVLLINGEIRLPLTKRWNSLSVSEQIFLEKSEALHMQTLLNDAQSEKLNKLMEAITALQGMFQSFKDQRFEG